MDSQKFRKSLAQRIGAKWTDSLMVYDDDDDDDDDEYVDLSSDDDEEDDDDQYQYKYLPTNAEIYQAKILGRIVLLTK